MFEQDSKFWRLMFASAWVFTGVLAILLAILFLFTAGAWRALPFWEVMLFFAVVLSLGTEGAALIIIYTKKAMEVLGCGSSKE